MSENNAIKIDKKITGYAVVSKADKEQQQAAPVDATASTEMPPTESLESMHEKITRPEILLGLTYKIKTPQSEHALYITINDMVMNEGTANESRIPYEIFINSKNMEHFQWILALTRVISAVFRKGGDVCFLVEELKNVFDPKGGYFKKGGVYMPSLVAEIGWTIEAHLVTLGMISNELDAERKKFIAAKRKEFEASMTNVEEADDQSFPPQAQLCHKCNHKSLVLMDGCMTCLNCGESKCG